jgi:ABC-type transport system involved in multi-copper enzyme maturation permease subunit
MLEAVRRKLFIASLIIAVIFFLLSLLPHLMGTSGSTQIGPDRMRMTLGVLLCVFLGLPMLRFFAAVQAVILGAGGISGEIERGSLPVTLARPVSRAQVMLGKWLGINLLLGGHVLTWAALLWASLFIQTGEGNVQLLYGALPILLYPALFSSLSLLFSTFTSPTLAAALTLICGGIAWSEGILKMIARLPLVDLPLLERVGHACSFVVPMAHVDRWTDRLLGDLSPIVFAERMGRPPAQTAAAGDLVYVALYILAVFGIGLLLFHRRDI